MIFAANKPNRRSGMLLRGLAAGTVGLAVSCAPSAGAAETHVIEIRDFQFSTAVINVVAGDTITWVNMDIAPHTATATDGAWDSGALEHGDEWSLVVEEAGSIDYICTFHPQMTGVINVE